jgi:hypothetical protein
MENALALILEKKAALEAERDRIKTRLNMIEFEIADHETAIRIIQRATGKLEPKPNPIKHAKKHKQVKSSLPSKPAGIPTVPEMITQILQQAETEGHSSLQSKTFLEVIQGKWWPEATSELVGPTLWRLWKAERLNKDGDQYSLPKKNKTADPLLPAESAALEQEPQAQGGEARQGGGT